MSVFEEGVGSGGGLSPCFPGCNSEMEQTLIVPQGHEGREKQSPSKVTD